jgi:uncharacterized membrane protein YgcG
MLKQLKFLILGLFFIAAGLLVPSTALAEQISDYNVYLKLSPDSDIKVVEKISYDFGSAQRHGIFREIPITKANKDGIKYKLDIDVESIKTGNGQNVPYSTSTSGENLVIKIGDPNKTITGENIYTIAYTVKGASTYYSDHDELYWNLVGTNWQVPVAKARATIDLSDFPNVPLTQSSFICFTGAQGVTTKACTIQVGEKNQVSILSTVPLNAYEGLTFAVALPKGTLAVNEPPVYSADDVSNSSSDGSGLWIFSAMFILNILIALGIILWWFFNGRDPKDDRVLVREYDAPKDINGKEMSPLEMGTIVDEKIDSRDISAELVHLAVSKYLILKENEKNKKITVLRGPKLTEDLSMASLKPHQQELIQALDLDTEESADLGDSSTRDAIAKKISTLQNNLYKNLTEQGYFKSNPQSVRTRFFIIGFAMMFIGFMVPGVLTMILAYFMPSKTKLGVEAKRHALGLKQFLVSQERQFEFQEKNFYLFEKLLPYAIAFNVAKVWAKKFEDLYDYRPDWYESGNMDDFNTYLLIDALNRDLRTMEVSYTPTPTTSSTGHSSGFSGGGFSGGGGGGGGGGSW